MPDPVVILTAMGVACAISAAFVAAFGWRRPGTGSSWVGMGWVLGISAGFFVGCWMLGNRPHWPLREDQDRWFVLLLPAVLVVELLALLSTVPRWIVWPLRAVVVAGTAPVLLYGSSYLSADSEWSTGQSCLIVGGLAAFLAVVWALLGLHSSRAPGTIHAFCLAVTSVGAALAVMLSGYATGGQNGLALAAALLGAAAVVAILKWQASGAYPVGVAIVALYCLLVVGRFFGELSSTHGILLFASPLLVWLPELPGMRRLPVWARNLTQVLLVALVVGGVVFDTAWHRSDEPAAPSGTDEPSAEDYANFGR
jgi:hypothetical protein